MVALSITMCYGKFYFIQIHETVEQINSIRIQREFFLGFSENPQVRTVQWDLHYLYNLIEVY